MTLVNQAQLNIAAKSHPGMSGKNNEDRYAVTSLPAGPNRLSPSVLAVIADGIGGHRAGEIAAEIAVETITRVVTAGDIHHPLETLETAIIEASQAIYQQSEMEESRRGMGATCACCWVVGDRLYTANVGDSRIYLLRRDEIHQLSTDHTWIQEAIDQGALTPDQARGHPNAHVIRRYLGSRQPVVPDLRLRLRSQESDAQAEANQGIRLQPGDQVLLSSDGLTDLVTNAEIQSIIKNHPAEEAVDRLIELANQRGGHDNITIVNLQVPVAAAAVPVPVASTASTQALPEARPLVPAGSRRLQLTCLSLGALALAGIILVGALVWWMNRDLAGLPPSSSQSTATSGAATQAAVTSSPTSLQPGTPTAPIRSATAAPRVSPTVISTAPTLTPWPTNTPGP